MLDREFVSELILQSKQVPPEQLARLIGQAGAAPFAEDLLEVEESLWGGFWQGDVIAPGYSLPAVELALLRAIRLEETWPEGTTVTEFLADLRQAITEPHAGVWMLAVAGEPCIAFASTGERRAETGNRTPETSGQRSAVNGRFLATVVWHCATTERLHAGYRTPIASLNFKGAVEQRPLQVSYASHEESTSQSSWLEQMVEQATATDGWRSAVSGHSLAAQLDAEILRIQAQMR